MPDDKYPTFMIISHVSRGDCDDRHAHALASTTNSQPAPHSPKPPNVRTSVSQFPGTYSPVRVIHIGIERATYTPFRETFFHDPAVNTRLRGEGGEPDARSIVRESKRLWTAKGPHINARTAKTATCPGSAFKNQALSADRLYSTNRNSLGYDVHRSLRGTSLCSTTKRFDQKSKTPEGVGPGSYNVSVLPSRQMHHPPLVEPPKSAAVMMPSSRLQQWGGQPDARAMDSADEWKTTSEKPTPTTYSFHRARQATWIEQIEERQRRSDPEARPLQSHHRRVATAEQRLPNFIQGSRTSFSTKADATASILQQTSTGSSSPMQQTQTHGGEESQETIPEGVTPLSSCPSSTDTGFHLQAAESSIKLIIPTVP